MNSNNRLTKNLRAFGAQLEDEKASYDTSTHHLLQLKNIPAGLVALREELQLPKHADIMQAAAKGATFEESIGIIAAQLGIALNDVYDVGPLCSKLAQALKQRFIKMPTAPELHRFKL